MPTNHSFNIPTVWETKAQLCLQPPTTTELNFRCNLLFPGLSTLCATLVTTSFKRRSDKKQDQPQENGSM